MALTPLNSSSLDRYLEAMLLLPGVASELHRPFSFVSFFFPPLPAHQFNLVLQANGKTNTCVKTYADKSLKVGRGRWRGSLILNPHPGPFQQPHTSAQPPGPELPIDWKKKKILIQHKPHKEFPNASLLKQWYELTEKKLWLCVLQEMKQTGNSKWKWHEVGRHTCGSVASRRKSPAPLPLHSFPTGQPKNMK